jgi:hypothetical protein
MIKPHKPTVISASPIPVQMLSQGWLRQKPASDASVGEFVWLRSPHRRISEKGSAIRGGISTQSTQVALPLTRAVYPNRFFQDTRRPPQLVPLFPVGNYTPHSRCGHRGPIERNSVFCCMVCHTSGQDDHPALQNSSFIKPNSEVKRDATIQTKYPNQRISLETRKQRRQRLYSGILNSPRVYFYSAK